MHRPTPSPRARSAALCLLLHACTPAEPATEPTAAVRDSAGVRIVENHGDASTTLLRIEDSPALQIGAIETEAAYQFHGIGGVQLQSTGGVAVTNTGTGDIRVFDNRGRLVGWSGRLGGGPGEYLTMSSLHRAPGDSMLVPDARAMRVTVIAPNGRYARDYPVAADAGRGGVVGVLADGALLLRRSTNTPEQSIELHRDTVAFELLRSDGTAAPLGRFGGGHARIGVVDFGGRRGVSLTEIPFTHAVHTAVGDSSVWIGSSSTWDIHRFDRHGALRLVIRSSHSTGSPVTRELLQQWVAGGIQTRGVEPTPRLVASNLQTLERLPRLETAPAHGPMIVTSSGELWVSEYPLPGAATPTIRWTIFDATGVLRGGIELPRRFNPHHVAGGLVAGVYRDELNVEYVRVYRLEGTHR